METPIKMDDLGVPPFTETTNKFLQDFLILKANRNPPHPTASEQQVKIKSHVGLSEKDAVENGGMDGYYIYTMPWEPTPSFLGVITLECKTFIFHGFGVQGWIDTLPETNNLPILGHLWRWVFLSPGGIAYVSSQEGSLPADKGIRGT